MTAESIREVPYDNGQSISNADIIQRYPLADAFSRMREEAYVEEVDSMDIAVVRVAHEDSKASLSPAHPTITREMVMDNVYRTTSEVLEVVGFDPEAGLLPESTAIRALAKAGRLQGIGKVFTEASEIARLWHKQTAYSPLALAPQYNGEDVLPIPKLREDGSAPQANEADRVFGGFLPVGIDDPARAAWRYHPDTIELRKRGTHLQTKIIEHFTDTDTYPDGSRVRIAAIAGGAAWPDMQAVAALGQSRPDIKVELDVFDWDKAAIFLGVHNATTLLEGIADAKVKVIEDQEHQITTISAANTRVRFINADITNQNKLLAHADEDNAKGYDIVEAVGLVEYFPQDAAPFIIASMDSLLKDKVGLGIVANMTEYHDHPQILGVIGWRALRPRSLSDIARFVDEGIKMSDSNRVPDKKLEILDEKSYLYTTWRK